MGYPGGDGKSGVDKSSFPKQEGRAKQGFDKAQEAKPEPQKTTDRASSGVSESIKKHTPALNHDMPGGGPVRAAQAGNRLSKEIAELKMQQAAEKTAAKNMAKSKGMEQNVSKSRDTGRE